MRRILTILFILSIALIVGCSKKEEKKLNRNISLWKNDKIPYGTWFAYNQLQSLFPKAKITSSKKSPLEYPEVNSIYNSAEPGSGKSARIIIVREFMPSPNERQALLNYVWEGNQLLLSAFDIDNNFLDSLNLKLKNAEFSFEEDNAAVSSIENFETFALDSFYYPGFTYRSNFQEYDSTYTSILGRNSNGKANFVRIQYSNGGAIYIHSNPFVFTNFFLLHKDNRTYYELALSQFPERIQSIEWNEYFRNNSSRNSKNSVSRALSWALKQPALALALLLLLILLILVYFFDTKRKQRKIEEKPPLRNTSLDFARTIGQLYYQQHNNSNLVQKMAQHFYEHVRTHLNIPSTKVDDSFVSLVAFKTGIEQAELKSTLYLMKQLSEQPEVSDEEVILLNNKLESFYKQA